MVLGVGWAREDGAGYSDSVGLGGGSPLIDRQVRKCLGCDSTSGQQLCVAGSVHCGA